MEQGVALLELLVADHLLDQSDLGRARQGVRDAEHDLEERDVPDVGIARDQECGGRDLCGALDEVAAARSVLPRQPIGEDPAEEHEDDDRHLARKQHDPEVDRAAELEDGKRQGNHGHPGAEVRDALGGEVAGEVAFAKRVEGGGDAHRPESRWGACDPAL